MKVKNGSCVRRLAWNSLRANKTRNLAAVLAIALTALLFTALFTIVLFINSAVQGSNFRMVGGSTHGSFKNLSPEQYEQLKSDPLIRESGLHRFLGGAEDACFAKTQVELHYWDPKAAAWSYCVPTVGKAPEEGSDEAAADLLVLRALGLEPELGAAFTLTLNIGGRETQQQFHLSGWWEGDPAAPAHIVLIPESRVDAVLQELGYSKPYDELDNGVGMWGLDVMLKSSRNIAGDMETILERHGYQSLDVTRDDYVKIGVNWGYTGAQLSASADGQTVAILVLLLGVILLTGYLVIYNVFRISVAGDIRFYGLLKTVGTTGRQLRRIVRLQALALSAAGIPLGLLSGWFTGGALAPAVLNNLDVGAAPRVAAHPLVFLAAGAFALGTVLLSCARPGRLAAKVSPVEALRYTEGAGRGTTRRAWGRVSPFSMAWANLGRSRAKTLVTVLSLALAVLLLCLTVFFTDGFDMNKYLRDKTVCDFIVGPNEFFSASSYMRPRADVQEAADAVTERGGVADGGRMYFQYPGIQESVSEEFLLAYYSGFSPDFARSLVEGGEPVGEGRRAVNAMVYGAEPFLLDRLGVLEGDLSRLYEPGGRYLAAVCAVDDYGNAQPESVWAHAGDLVTLRYVEESEYYDPQTGYVYGEGEDLGNSWAVHAVKYADVEYEVAAVVTLPWVLSLRATMGDSYILNAESFLEQATMPELLYYAFDAQEDANAAMEAFLASYTNGEGQAFNYESRASYEAAFRSFRNMFLLLGGVLSFVVGLVGCINFVNAVLTGITARRRELAMLQAVGMTGRQLKAMLIWEGLFYALGAALLALVLSALLEPLLSNALERAFWFFSGSFTLTPALLAFPVFALLGALVPLFMYRIVSRRSVVERLRETEG